MNKPGPRDEEEEEEEGGGARAQFRQNDAFFYTEKMNY